MGKKRRITRLGNEGEGGGSGGGSRHPRKRRFSLGVTVWKLSSAISHSMTSSSPVNKH